MALFVKHVPCTVCGSRDNRATYDDGSSYCFGCGDTIRGDLSSSRIHSVVDDRQQAVVRLPNDYNQVFPEHVVDWLKKYDVKIEEAIKWGWVYSPYWDQLIFPFYGEDESQLILWQGRNFSAGIGVKHRSKYYNQGSPQDILPIFSHPRQSGERSSCLYVVEDVVSAAHSASRRLVVVEDAVSAAKIARQTDAMPCLGSYLPAKKLMRLRPFYEFLTIWLDEDKLKEAREIADMAKWIGFRTKVVYTELDPKEYNDTEISNFLK